MPHVARCTRLAPSPTGALHLGNARTFLITWAIARREGMRLPLRIEDFDTPRIKPGAAAGVLRCLEWLGVDWDRCDNVATSGPGSEAPGCLVQSHDLEPYLDAMRSLASRGLAYPCRLSRAEIDAAASAPNLGDSHDVPYPMHLRPPLGAFDFDAALSGSTDDDSASNWRFAASPGPVEFDDRFAGEQQPEPSKSVGDFILWTKRRQPSYQLAVVVDDHRQGVTDVIRGDDLIDSAGRQLLLYRALGYSPEPRYTHLPLVLGPDGRRLAKRHGDTRVDAYRERGVPSEAVIGLLASWSGILPRTAPRPTSAAEFRDRFDLDKLPHQPVTFTPEDDRWLVSQARKR